MASSRFTPTRMQRAGLVIVALAALWAVFSFISWLTEDELF
jgi:hypothetical protein